MKTKSARDEEILDWTVSDTPFAEAVEILDSAAPPEAAPTPRPTFNFKTYLTRRAALMLAGASLAILLVVAGYTTWQNFVLKQTLTPLVLAEDEARLSGDTDKLHEFMDDEDANWKYDQSSSGPSFPSALAWPLPETGAVKSVTRFGPELVRVDVERPYSNQPDQDYYGWPIANRNPDYIFTQTQFYKWNAKDQTWKRVRAPDDFFGEQRSVWSGHIEWKFPAADSDLIEAVRPNVEQALNDACELWACPAEFGLTVTFITRTLPSQWYSGLPFTQDSLLLNFYQNDGGAVYGTNTLIIHSPHMVGTPADAATQKLYERTLTLRVLANTLHRLNTERGERRNIFWMALAARLASRFDFENQSYRTVIAPEPLFTPEELWNKKAQRNAGQYTVELRDAQILLNRLLAYLPPEAEQKLLLNVNAAQNHVDWLVQALNISVEEAEGYWQAALTPIQVAPATNVPDQYALFCPSTTGLSLWDGTENPPYAALPESVLSGQPVSWSPDGQRLSLRVGYFGEQMGVVDFAARRVIWLPDAGGWPLIEWLSNTRLIYLISIPSFVSSFGSVASRVVLFDTAQPNQPLVELGEFNNFRLSPDRSEIAVVGGSGGEEALGVLSPESGEVRWLARGQNPMWVAPNRHIVFTSQPQTSAAQPSAELYRLDTQTGATLELLTAENLRPLLPDEETHIQGLNVLSTRQDEIYIAGYLGSSTTFAPDTWLGRMKIDGSGLQTLYLGENSWANFYGLLEDEAYALIAAQSYQDNQSTLLIVETATGQVARTIKGYNLWYGSEAHLAGPLFTDASGRFFSLPDPFGELQPYQPNSVTQLCGDLVRNPALGGP